MDIHLFDDISTEALNFHFNLLHLDSVVLLFFFSLR